MLQKLNLFVDSIILIISIGKKPSIMQISGKVSGMKEILIIIPQFFSLA